MSYTEQIGLLRARNLAIDDEAAALAALQRIGYYRLVGYWYPLRRPDPNDGTTRLDAFQDGATFELAVELYDFDRALRLVVLDAIERIEVAVRVDVAHHLGKRHRLAHERPALMDGKFQHAEWFKRYTEGVRKKAKEDFVAHHVQRYNGRMPIWVATETWDFGLLSKFYAGMKYKDQQRVAQRYRVDGPVLGSWLRALNFVRNVSAHHARLWNRNNPDALRMPPMHPQHHLRHLTADEFARRRVYGSLCVMQHMLKTIEPDTRWSERIQSLCAKFPTSDLVGLRNGGFPEGWGVLPLWQTPHA
ncbi:MAG TPA: Abi family protein [Trinickia sp.]|nr:Abi family protein [Trinickia sp.]